VLIMIYILFLCAGNTCRSPMAKGFMKDLARSDPDIVVQSAGLSASNGQPASRYSIDAMKEIGIDISSHSSQPISEKLIEDSSIIFVMTRGHLHHLLALYPSPKLTEKVFLVNEFNIDKFAGCHDVLDPYGQDMEIYRQTRNELQLSIASIYQRVREMVVMR